MSNQTITKTKKVEKLTEGQEKFVKALLEGKSQADAYRYAYDTSTMKKEVVWTSSSDLAKLPKVVSRFEQLKKTADKKIIPEIIETRKEWTKDRLIGEFEKLKEMCTRTAKNPKTGEIMFKEAGALRSLENIGELLGMYEKKVEVDMTVKMPNIMIANTVPNLQIEGSKDDSDDDCIDVDYIDE